MSDPVPTSQNPSYSPSQALALVIGTFGVGFPSFLYWKLGSSLLGQYPLAKVFLISGISGILSFALYAGRKLWLIASIIGFFGGVGASASLLIYTSLFEREMMWTTEIVVIQVLGALPAMALFAYIVRRSRAS